MVLGELELRGPAGEPVDWRRTLASHGVATLPPNRLDEGEWTLDSTIAFPDGRARSVRLRQARPGWAEVLLIGAEPVLGDSVRLLDAATHLLRLGDDLSRFYARARRDPELGWVVAGAGRMLRGQTVFEDVVKTICTTNCSWAATERMVGALVEDLGQPDGSGRHAFPSPEAMARAGEPFYRERARAGYRGPYLQALAAQVTEGRLDLEALRDPVLSDAEAEDRLLALPGVGPYATAHIMLTALGRYRLLVLDSWTRPTYARLSGRRAGDRAVQRRFARFG